MLSKIEDKEKAPLAAIFGIEGEALTREEKELFQRVNPLGFILFTRNCNNPEQTRALIASLHDCLGREAPILIDQEGGRVQRLKATHWKDYPPARQFGEAFLRDFSKGRDSLKECAASMASDLVDLGVNVNCAPVMDVLYQDTHEAIGDRAFAKDPEIVAVLGAVTCDEFLKAGIIPVMKHMPGQGRAASDSHNDLPVVNATIEEMRQSDFVPFRELQTKAFSEAVWGMVSHIVYRDIDARAPASCSRRVVWDTIRKDVGFDGLLLSDDICMGALETIGDVAARTDKALRAGCDVVLHCNGDLPEMQNVAARAQKMTNDAVMRYNRSVSWVNRNFEND